MFPSRQFATEIATECAESIEKASSPAVAAAEAVADAAVAPSPSSAEGPGARAPAACRV